VVSIIIVDWGLLFMNIFTNLREKKLSLQLIGIFFLFYFIQLVLGGFIVYQVALNQTSSSLRTISQRVKEDIIYTKGKWDMQRYNSDPDVPGTYPLYILGTDGFVLDRWKPVHGFLD